MSPLIFLFLIPSLFILSCALEFHYHSNHEMEQYLVQVNASNPDITHLYSIGQSVKGQQLWVLAVGVHPHSHSLGVPEFKYVANMHGNEALGRVLLLRLVDDLVSGYRKNESWSLRLLSSTRIHILPSMNPDGFDQADTHCVYSQGRHNYNGVDLNRNFPDAFASLRKQPQIDEKKREAEVKSVIAWLRTESFVLSANLHGGALVASYPYDNSNRGSEYVGGASVTPDNDVFVHLSKVYSLNHGSMTQSHCDNTKPFTDGITNGYQWYPLAGGMQDYNYVWAQCLEITLEVSCCKFPPADQLPALWAENRKSLLAFIQQVHLGVKGRVMDGAGVPVHNAVVEVKGRRNMCPFKTDRHGEYYRLLLPGTYTFTVTYPGHRVLTETLNVPYGPDQNSAMTHDFLLSRVAVTTGYTSARPTATLSQIESTCNHSLEGSGAKNTPFIQTVIGIAFCLLMLSVMD